MLPRYRIVRKLDDTGQPALDTVHKRLSYTGVYGSIAGLIGLFLGKLIFDSAAGRIAVFVIVVAVVIAFQFFVEIRRVR